jgi:hypothetical protein
MSKNYDKKTLHVASMRENNFSTSYIIDWSSPDGPLLCGYKEFSKNLVLSAFGFILKGV